MESLLNTLRQETSTIHHALHEHPILQSCQKGTMNITTYIHLLKAFYSPWALLTPAISSVPLASLRPKLALRAQAIHDDLVNLQVDQKTLEPTAPNQILSKEQLLGMCYVLIGSSMGATSLSASIKTSLGDVPLTYLSMTPKEAGWPELVSSLRNLDSKKYASAAIAALDTFKLIQTKLSN